MLYEFFNLICYSATFYFYFGGVILTISETFKALADPARRKILKLLKDGTKKSAGEISSHFELSQATISHHLSVLKDADLIRQSKEKNFVYYELNSSVFEEILAFFSDFLDKNAD